jgi:two-component system cell cycle sensor histidine kinase/response regulator CckA
VAIVSARILVIEDDNIVLMELKDQLHRLGHLVVGTASSGDAAIERAVETQPDLVLMDIRLKGDMDGIEAATEIRARCDIPVVYLTAYTDEATLQRAMVTEPYGYIIKPFQPRELNTAIEIGLYKHQIERKLKESEQWLATTLNSISDAVMATDSDGLVTFLNPLAEELTGWRQDGALGRPVAEVLEIVPEERPVFAKDPVMRTLQKGVATDLSNHVLLTRDGRVVPIDGSCARIKDEAGHVNGVVLTFRDISRRKREEEEREKLQAQLFQAQKMEAIGLLAGAIAHDLSNQLTPVIGYSSLLLSWLADDDPARERIEVIHKAGEQASALIQQILAFSRKQLPRPKVLDLNDVITDLGEMLERLIGEGTELDKALEDGYRYVKADPAQIGQVVINLVLNALDAMPTGGRLTIKTELVHVNGDQCRHPDAHAGDFVCLSVVDTGVGMSEQTVQRIFEPFYTTKKTGSGLGLSTVYTIVKQYDGWIDVDSEPGEGSTFQVYLPACSDPEYETIDVVRPAEFQGNGERILLVEDDGAVRDAVAEMLRAGGYSVVDVGTAEAALKVFEWEEGDFQLVFSDVVLPNKDGLELVDELLGKKPGLSIVLSSGYTDNRSQWPAIRERGYHFLQKPYGVTELLPVVREALM